MPTEITFLRNLERDLTKVAETDKRRAFAEARSVRRRRWRGWATAAATLLGVALVIGVVQSLGGASSSEFSSVGAAVNGGGGGGSYYSSGGSASSAGGDVSGFAPGPTGPP